MIAVLLSLRQQMQGRGKGVKAILCTVGNL